MSNNKYYLYAYIDPVTQVPFYIGYGSRDRSQTHLKEAKRSNKSNHKLNKIRLILKSGNEPLIRIWFDRLNKQDAIHLEISYIKLYGRIDQNTGCLVNHTNGGDGNTGWSSEAKSKMSVRRKNMIMVKDHNGNCLSIRNDDPRWLSGELVGFGKGSSNSNLNGRLTGYVLAKDSNGVVYRVKNTDPRWLSGELVGINKNKPAHPNTVKSALARKGTKRDPKAVEQGRQKLLGKPKSDAHRKKLSDALKNKPKTECEHCHQLFSPSNYAKHVKAGKCTG